jgi:acylphosphatase
MTSPVVARRVIVTGHVQGVFFRDRTRREASRRGVAGWVRNCADGTVEALFEGPSDAVAELVRWCRSGPRYATVHDVRVSDVEPDGLDGFSIR